jgi:DNA-binding NarL/FixJ family response regulator
MGRETESSDGPRRVLLVDDHGLVRHGVQLLILEALPQLQVVLAGSFREALETLAAARCELVLLDLALGDAQGLGGLQRLRALHGDVPVIVLSAHDDRETVLAALDHGAMGFISKTATPDELREALMAVAGGAIHLPRSVSSRTARQAPALHELGLTERQIEVLGYLVQGWSNKEIARQLDRSEVLVKKHVAAVLQVLGVPNRTRALVALSERGYRLPVRAEP